MFDELKFIIPVVLGFLFVTLGKFLDVRLSLEQTKKSKARIERAESNAESQPNKIKPAWELAKSNLMRLAQTATF